MLSALRINRYPQFDLSDISTEPDLVFKKHKFLEPVKTGDVLPDFALKKEASNWQQFIDGSVVQGPVLFSRFLNKPLVIGFYSHKWQQYGLDLLRELSAIQNDIKEQGGSLLIISSRKDRELEKIVWDSNLSLSFYFDRNNEIAENFSIYSENDPIWNRFSGIDTNVPLLATYVVSTSGQIEYAHVDPDFSKSFPAKDIISAVKNAEQYIK